MKYFAVIFFVLIFSPLIGQNVYTTKTGEKYHKETCHYLKTSKVKLDLPKAVEKGYTPCKVCKPSANAPIQSNINKISPTAKTTGKSGSVSAQCTGKTKAGKRCLRMTKSSNGRCYQHQ